MIPRPALAAALAAAAVSLLPSIASAAGADLAQEYDQVQKIALRDPKVRDAFDRAHQRLEEKIVELDPALKNYASHRQNAPEAVATARPAPQPFHTAEAAPTPKPKPKPAPPVHSAVAASQPTHLVVAGETIASISNRYHVTAASLEAANHITDPRKLQAGQTLVIPGGHASASAAGAHPSASPAPAPADPQSDGILDKLKRNF